jgi:site-specific recombinase XerD
MKTKNTLGITFFIKKKRAKEGKAPVYAKITVDGLPTELSLKSEIEIEKWKGSKILASGRDAEIQSLNDYIGEVRSGLKESYRQLQLQRKLITAEAVKKHFLGEDEKEHTLINAFSYHNKEMQKELEPGTQKNYHTTKKYVVNFLKNNHHTTDILLSQLNYKFIVDFEKFVKANPLSKKPCTQNGTMKHIERLKKVVNQAIKFEWLDKDPFIKYSSHFIKKDRGYLTPHELEAIENKDFTINRLQLVKDMFVFSCYAGLAYIDLMKLSPKDIRMGIDRQYWIFSARKKIKNTTVVEVKIPLLPKAMKIIEKYKNDPNAISHGKVFPSITNQRLNSYLKEIGDLCGIEKDLTFHRARHTFATTVTLTNGVPLETVSKLLGHSSTKTTEIYAKVVEQKISDDIGQLRAKLEEQNKSVHNSTTQHGKVFVS